jgi:DNA repair ATPase RecN
MKQFSDDRLHHSAGVAELMYKMAKNEPFNFSEQKAREMYSLGALHDIGYNFLSGDETHEETGYEILRKAHYKYAKEIRAHGNPRTKYKSKALDLLNACDMLVDSKGKRVSFEERLEDIKERHGELSSDYRNSKAIIEDLAKKGLDLAASLVEIQEYRQSIQETLREEPRK